MVNHHLRFITLFIFCGIFCGEIRPAAAEAGPTGHADPLVNLEQKQTFSKDYESYLENNKVHPWCGYGLKGEWEVQYAVPDGDNGVRFVNKEEYETLIAERPREI